ncbi:unnamed protein product [Citrullus colocynthis]|uniref:Uncharacterized protein n=1 Tax=Citrullus colocynthis TaxID=252529 RepID=A0ABP0YUB3_9ROSI
MCRIVKHYIGSHILLRPFRIQWRGIWLDGGGGQINGGEINGGGIRMGLDLGGGKIGDSEIDGGGIRMGLSLNGGGIKVSGGIRIGLDLGGGIGVSGGDQDGWWSQDRDRDG